MATMPRFTIMREDVSYVLAREYGDPRDSTTILAALLAIGGAKRVLILSDDDDGVWTLTSDVTIPANVTLSLPSGVTLAGSGNLTIAGNLLTLRTDWWQSTGAAIWIDSQTSWFASRARLGQLALDIPLPITSGGTDANNVPQAQINLGIVPGTDIQPYDPTLAAFAAAATGPNLLWYFTGVDSGATTAFTPLARTLVGNSTPGAMQTTLGLGALAPLNAVDTLQIVDRAVTYAKIQNVTNARLLGRADSVAGVMQEISVGPGLTLTGGVLGMQGGAVSGSGVANRATFWTGATAQSYDDGYQYNPTTHLLTVPRFFLSDQTNHAFVMGLDASEAPGFSHAYLRFTDTVTNTPQWLTGLRITEFATRGAVSPTAVIGLAVHTNLNQASFNVSGTPEFDLLGIEAWTYATGTSGAIGTMGGLSLKLNNTAAGTVTSMFCIHVASANSGVLNNWYGIVLRNPPAVTVGSAIGYYSEVVAGTARYNLYLAGSAINYMAGALGVGAAPPADLPGGIYTPNWLRAGGLHSTGDVNAGNNVNVTGWVVAQKHGGFQQGVSAGATGAVQGGRMFDCWGSAYVQANLTVGNDIYVPHVYATGISWITGPLRVGDQAAPGYTLDVNGDTIIRGHLGAGVAPLPGQFNFNTGSIHCTTINADGGISTNGLSAGATTLSNTTINNSVGIGLAILAGYNLHTGTGRFTGNLEVQGTMTANTVQTTNLAASNVMSIGPQGYQPGWYLSAKNCYVNNDMTVGGTTVLATFACSTNGYVSGSFACGPGVTYQGGYYLSAYNCYLHHGIYCNVLDVRSGPNHIAGVLGIWRNPSAEWALAVGSGNSVWADGQVQSQTLYARDFVRATNAVYAGGGSGIQIETAVGNGAMSWAYGVRANPSWNPERLVAVHVHGAWAGWRMESDTAANYVDFYQSGGGAYLSAGSWVDAVSDRRVKRNITPIDTPLTRLQKLHGCHYERTDLKIVEGFPAPNPWEYGLIAQDVAEALPDAALARDMGDGHEPLLNYTNRPILALLVEAVKELAQQVAELKAAKEAA